MEAIRLLLKSNVEFVPAVQDLFLDPNLKVFLLQNLMTKKKPGVENLVVAVEAEVVVEAGVKAAAKVVVAAAVVAEVEVEVEAGVVVVVIALVVVEAEVEAEAEAEVPVAVAVEVTVGVAAEVVVGAVVVRPRDPEENREPRVDRALVLDLHPEKGLDLIVQQEVGLDLVLEHILQKHSESLINMTLFQVLKFLNIIK